MSETPAPEYRKVPPLSEDELCLIREVIEAQKRWHWLGTVIRNTAAWLAVVIGGAIVAWQAFKDTVRSALQ